jgi:hypothetical protein
MNSFCVFDFNNEDGVDRSFDSLMLYGKLESISGGMDYDQTPLNLKVVGL